MQRRASPGRRRASEHASTVDLDTLRDALLAAKVAAYAQGFAVMAAASSEHGWDLDLGTIARIWRGGCIIRARLLNRMREAYAHDAALANLMLDPYFAALLGAGTGWSARDIVLAARRGIAAPALGSALAYYDGYRSARLPANLIQAQRDYFGAHTYERVDRPGSFHSDWAASEALLMAAHGDRAHGRERLRQDHGRQAARRRRSAPSSPRATPTIRRRTSRRCAAAFRSRMPTVGRGSRG